MPPTTRLSRRMSSSTRFSNDPAEAPKKIACSRENECFGLVSIAPEMKLPMMRRASASSLWARSQASKVISSYSAARGCSHGAAGSTSRESRVSSARSLRISSRVSGLTGKSPVKRWRLPSLSMNTESPSRWRWKSSSPSSAARSWIAVCSGAIHWPPISRKEPSIVSDHVRPPTRSRASSTATVFPVWLRRRAAVSPAGPAPMMTTSRVISCMVLLLLKGFS